jgi:hypothetical protein
MSVQAQTLTAIASSAAATDALSRAQPRAAPHLLTGWNCVTAIPSASTCRQFGGAALAAQASSWRRVRTFATRLLAAHQLDAQRVRNSLAPLGMDHAELARLIRQGQELVRVEAVSAEARMNSSTSKCW